jgi:menaquinone-dependent protoporphyrinogen oxidase
MANILIVYGSSDGQTGKVAEFLGERFRGCGHDVDLLNGKRLPRNFDISRYAAVIVAASVRRTKYQRNITNFARRYRGQLEAVPSAFVSVSMAEAKGGFQQAWLDWFVNQSGWKPAHFASFAGALMYRKYNFITRFLMKKISQKVGLTTDTSKNHEYTDWDNVGRFANEFAEYLGSE